MTPREIAQFWMLRGAKVLPLGANKAPVVHLVHDGWHDASSDPKTLWWYDHDDTALVGIVPGSMGLLVLDVDVKGEVNGNDTLAALEAEFSPVPRTHVIRTRSGGKHIYLTKPDPEEHIGNTDLCEAVNVRCDGGYVVAPGCPGYTDWRDVGGPTPGVAPAWVVERLEQNQKSLEDPYEVPDAHEEDEWDAKVLEAYRRFDAKGDRHTTMATAVNALASYELLGYAGSTSALRELEHEFVIAVEDRSNDAEARREYRRALNGARRRVREHESTVLAERKADASFIEMIKASGGSDEDAERLAALAEEAERRDKLQMYSMRELKEYDFKFDWLVRNVLTSPTYGQIAGASKSFKSYISQYLGLAVATGERFLGKFPVDKQGPVVFLVGEGGMKGWTQRMPRIGESVGLDLEAVWGAPIEVSFTPVPFLSPTFKNTVTDILERVDPVLTIVDSLYNFHGGETEAQNVFQQGALLSEVSKPFIEHGSTILINNHFNKAQGKPSLNRITMSGSGEWVDSWMLLAQREDPDLTSGEFYLRAEFGGRQWGGTSWEIDLGIGLIDPMTGEPNGPIDLAVRRSFE